MVSQLLQISHAETEPDDVDLGAMLPSLRKALDVASWSKADQGSEVRVAVVFVDLCDSVRLYRRMGDAAAVRAAMNAFQIVADAVRRNDGSVVKIIGDAVMAVFEKPAAALRATIESQQAVSGTRLGRLALRAGIHFGQAIPVTVDHRLDYFGTTINVAARITRYSEGHEVIISRQVYDDHEGQRGIGRSPESISAGQLVRRIKGFDAKVTLWRLKAINGSTPIALALDHPIVKCSRR